MQHEPRPARLLVIILCRPMPTSPSVRRRYVRKCASIHETRTAVVHTHLHILIFRIHAPVLCLSLLIILEDGLMYHARHAVCNGEPLSKKDTSGKARTTRHKQLVCSTFPNMPAVQRYVFVELGAQSIQRGSNTGCLQEDGQCIENDSRLSSELVLPSPGSSRNLRT